MSPETVDKIQEALEPLADLAEQGASFSWEVLVRQVVISGWMHLIGGIIALLVFIALATTVIILTRRYFSFSEYDRRDHEGEALVAFLLGFVSLFAIGITADLVTSGIPRLLNPGYYALKEVASMVGLN